MFRLIWLNHNIPKIIIIKNMIYEVAMNFYFNFYLKSPNYKNMQKDRIKIQISISNLSK